MEPDEVVEVCASGDDGHVSGDRRARVGDGRDPATAGTERGDGETGPDGGPPAQHRLGQATEEPSGIEEALPVEPDSAHDPVGQLRAQRL